MRSRLPPAVDGLAHAFGERDEVAGLVRVARGDGVVVVGPRLALVVQWRAETISASTGLAEGLGDERGAEAEGAGEREREPEDDGEQSMGLRLSDVPLVERLGGDEHALATGAKHEAVGRASAVGAAVGGVGGVGALGGAARADASVPASADDAGDVRLLAVGELGTAGAGVAALRARRACRRGTRRRRARRGRRCRVAGVAAAAPGRRVRPSSRGVCSVQVCDQPFFPSRSSPSSQSVTVIAGRSGSSVSTVPWRTTEPRAGGVPDGHARERLGGAALLRDPPIERPAEATRAS